MSGAYYNEIDKIAAEWLRNLIKAGHIAPGDVDERSIEDVRPDDLRGYTQCHFFAGIGIWSLALRRAGIPDTQPVWTGSCPCQPFSAAGAGAGFADERHLWPAFHYLIEQRRPARVYGEQVASKDADPWIDLVSTDLEALGYSVGAVAFPSAGIGAPHIRDRLYWVADADNARLEGRRFSGERAIERPARSRGVAGRLADAKRAEFRGEGPGQAASSSAGVQGANGQREWIRADAWTGGPALDVGMADSTHGGRREECAIAGWRGAGNSPEGVTAGLVHGGADNRPGPVNGIWRDADWLGCTDGKWRPVEPGTFPLVDGTPGRVGRLRAYGNAINAEAATEFIRACSGTAAAILNKEAA